MGYTVYVMSVTNPPHDFPNTTDALQLVYYLIHGTDDYETVMLHWVRGHILEHVKSIHPFHLMWSCFYAQPL